MAYRQIRKDGEEVLRKISRPVENIDKKILSLLEDMADTMYRADGVGLAAPQIGVLKRMVVIDVGDGLYEMINPVILEQSGEQDGIEGCLSILGVLGKVKRPMNVTLKYTDRNGEDITIEASEFFARAICHELDHLDGILYKDKAYKMYTEKEFEEMQKD
ncbi:peptide deformylase [Ruminiclostridium papyrosolvens DSM 2782]|uniref:Peptide deformylase n=1 Tax=Ruminiclostridium papyrosolvens DSM 2782 TaxID=588581 RepID=F1TDL9_9FIRM|nr:peptide deformylase [Ruminiclostridium papyrosolvens]EGD47657.1 peptide deformylase [Ruminiclostridium papyrosolvens DSM 2782]WES36400.1 peptide deformylase [Ruminiclostridium papyrosolvens DSM 2782]